MENEAIPIHLRVEYPFSSNRFSLPDGNGCHYLDEGEGPVVLMLHGNPTWSFYYRNLVKHLSSIGYRCIVPDHIGCGLSDKPQEYPYTLSRHIRNLECLLSHLEVQKFSLIVHDWGGAIGMGLATEHMEAVEKITILNTAAFLSKRIPLRIRICKTPVVGEFITRAFNAFAWPATWMSVTKKMSRSIKEGYLLPYNSWKNRIATWRFVQDIPLCSCHKSYDRLEQIDQKLSKLADKPMQIIWGGKDFCFDDSFYHEWVSRFPNAEADYLKDAGHYVLEDEAGSIEFKIETFLKS